MVDSACHFHSLPYSVVVVVVVVVVDVVIVVVVVVVVVVVIGEGGGGGKWFEPRGISYLFGVIVRVRLLLVTDVSTT